MAPLAAARAARRRGASGIALLAGSISGWPAAGPSGRSRAPSPHRAASQGLPRGAGRRTGTLGRVLPFGHGGIETRDALRRNFSGAAWADRAQAKRQCTDTAGAKSDPGEGMVCRADGNG